MEIFENRSGPELAFRLVGPFTFRDSAAFDRCVRTLREGDVARAHFDLSGVTELQTSAIGLLLILAEDARARGVALTMTPPEGRARAVLKMCRIESLFPFRQIAGGDADEIAQPAEARP